MNPDPLKYRAHPQLLRALADAGDLTPAAHARSLELAYASPAGGAWRSFLERLLLFLGTALVTTGVIFFFAYNWQDLGRFGKLGLLEAGILAAVLATWKLGTRKLSGQVALTAAAVLAVALMALYGQIYQTGADDYAVFLVAALLIAPWVVAGRFEPLWLVFWVLANTTFLLFWGQEVASRNEAQWVRPPVYLYLFLANGLAWTLGERFRRAVPRLRVLTALAALAALTVPCLQWIFEIPNAEADAALKGLAGVGWMAVIAFVLWFYRRREPQLFMLAAALASVVTVLTSVAFQWLMIEADGGAGHVLVVALVLIIQISGAAGWLRRVSREMEAT